MTEVVEVWTRHGPGRWHIDAPPGPPMAELAIGHGAGGGVTSSDLKLVTTAMVAAGLRVGRFEQPWRVAGRPVAAHATQLDAAWSDALPHFASRSLPLVVGGRSAGARVACRTAQHVEAVGVLALAFPLHPRGKPNGSRWTEVPSLPVLLVQGDRDPFGSAGSLAQAAAGLSSSTVLPIPGADHSLQVWGQGPITQCEADEIVARGAVRWTVSLVRGNHR